MRLNAGKTIIVLAVLIFLTCGLPGTTKAGTPPMPPSLYGWPLSTGTLIMTYDVPLSSLNDSSSDATYYLVRCDQAGYRLVEADLIEISSPAMFSALLSGDGHITPDGEGSDLIISGRASIPTRPARATTVHSQTSELPVVKDLSSFLSSAVIFFSGLISGCVAILIIKRFR